MIDGAIVAAGDIQNAFPLECQTGGVLAEGDLEDRCRGALAARMFTPTCRAAPKGSVRRGPSCGGKHLAENRFLPGAAG